jgi:ABC-type transport system involved in cytochrome c biogenesis permease subunit
MQKRHFRFVFLFFLLALMATLPFAASANNAWGNYHWARTSNPFTIGN